MSIDLLDDLPTPASTDISLMYHQNTPLDYEPESYVACFSESTFSVEEVCWFFYNSLAKCGYKDEF